MPQCAREARGQLTGGSVFFFHHVGPRDQTHAARLGSSTSLYQLSHFAGPFSLFQSCSIFSFLGVHMDVCGSAHRSQKMASDPLELEL